VGGERGGRYRSGLISAPCTPWGDRHEVVKGIDGRGAKAPAHLTEGVVLGHLQDGDESFACAIDRVPGCDAVCQRGDEDSVVEAAPGCKAEAADGVPEEGQAFEGGSCTSGHDFDVRLPGELGVDEEPEVADLLGEFDRDNACERVTVSDVGGGRADERWVGPGGEEDNCFSFVGSVFRPLLQSHRVMSSRPEDAFWSAE
jgi:hypothetical protein